MSAVGTAVPDAIDALYETLKAGLKPATVIDGPATPNVSGDAVWVGITPEDPTTDAPRATAGLRVSREQFEILCLARSWSGSADVAKQRRRAYALVKQASTVLDADKTLGGVVLMARLAGSLYTPYYTEQAQFVVDVVFRVSIDALV